METRAAYVTVGAFAILLFAGGLFLAIWFGGVRLDQETRPFRIEFEGSVTGLSVGSSVRYRGVPVGTVTDIAIDPDDDKTFWIVGMYQNPSGWQTWIDSFTIELPCPADINNDGNLDFFDVSVFIINFNEQVPSADINNDGVWNFFDVSLFLNFYSAGDERADFTGDGEFDFFDLSLFLNLFSGTCGP